ncbi:MAG: 2OG-Fe(II) oxygenase [Pararobbsia sp.]
MTVVVNFPQDVRDWLIAHLERGTPNDAIAAQLEAQNVPAALARSIVQTVARAVAAGTPPAAGRLSVDDDAPLAQAAYRPDAPLRAASAHTHRIGEHEVRVLARLERPALALFDGLLDDGECDALIALATPRLVATRVADPVTGRDVVAAHRSAQGAFFRPQETELVARIEARIEALTGVPREHGEGLQMVRYLPGTESTPHFDYLLTHNPANVESIERSGQRIATLIMYLNDVEAGGETTFPEVGMTVVPRKGHAVYFEYGNRLGQTDPASAHAGAPLRAGEKWIATKWLRARRFVPRGTQGA